MNAIRQQAYDLVVAQRLADSIRTGAGPTVPTIRTGADGARITTQIPAPPPIRQPFENAALLPDYFPPTDRNAVVADGDNNVWIRPNAEQRFAGFTVWVVINRAGVLIDRVRIPASQTIAGFGRGVVYLVRRGGGLSAIVKVQFK